MTPRDINGALKSLKRLKKGDRVASAASSDRLNAIQDIIRALVRGDNVVTDGKTIRKQTSEGHFVLTGNNTARAFGGTGEVEFPFEVVQVPKDQNDNSPGDRIGVISNSHLFNSEDNETYEEDNANWGLLEDDIPPSDPNSWNDNNYPGNKIWLQIELDPNQVIINIDVMHGLVGQGQWDTFPNPIEINDDDPDNVYQQFYHQIIAEITNIDDPRPGFQITNDSGDTVQVTQCLFDDLMMTSALTTRDADYGGLPLLVPVFPLMLPATSQDGNADEINFVPRNPDGSEGMTPWQYGARDKIWNFQINDASDDQGLKVEILDGEFNSVVPEGMGDDSFTVDITEWDTDGRVDIVLLVEYQLDGSFDANNIDIDAYKPQDYPEDEPFHVAVVGLGTVYVNPDGQSIDEIRNIQLGDINIDLVPSQVYAFQIFDASEDGNPQVLIYDGDVIDQDGEGHTPSEMGNDNFLADFLQDGDTFYLRIVHDDQWNITEDVTIEWDQQVPDDTEFESFIEFGYVEVIQPDPPDTVPQVIPHNTMCGDIFFDPPPPDDTNFDFKLEDASDGSLPRVRVYDGIVIGPNEGDLFEVSGMAYGNDTILDVWDGAEVYLGITWDQEVDNAISGENIIAIWIAVAQDTPDDDGLTNYITLGNVDVSFDGNGNAFVDCFNEVCGDVAIPYPPYLDSDQAAYLYRDVDTGNVVWKKSGITVASYNLGTDEDDSADNIDLLRFEPASDPSMAFIQLIDEGIDVDGMHVCTLQVPLIPESAGGFTVLVDDDGDTHWGTTTDCSA